MADFTIKRGDTYPPIEAVLSDSDGPLDLSTATSVVLLFKTATGGTAFSRTCTITSGVGGVVSYQWTSGDAATGPTSAVNTFNVEWEITWADGKITTVPNEGYKTVLITPDLG